MTTIIITYITYVHEMVSKKLDATRIKRNLGDWLKVTFLLLDEAAAVVLIILILRFFNIQIPLVLTIIIALLFGTVVFAIHIAVIPTFHKKKVSGREGMLSLEGRVVEPLKPSGTIMVEGERWKAKSVNDYIELDSDVEIIGIEGLVLTVQRKSKK